MRRSAAPLLALAWLAACTPMESDGPRVSDLPAVTPRPAPAGPVDTPDSAKVRRYYAQLQNEMLARGLMRTDGGGPDTPYDARILARNFIRIALYDEYTPGQTGYIARNEEDRLRRWDRPVAMSLQFGPTIPAAEQAADRARVAAFDARLARLTGLPIRLGAPETANFRVFVLNEDERRAFGPELRRIVPGISDMAVRTVTDLPLSTYCFVMSVSAPGQYTFGQAIAVIRGELPDLMREGCYHEELAQGLGPSNDSPAARPSIFNDDQEFLYLTMQDEHILRMLYDPRLTPGMTVEQAEPIVQELARAEMGEHA